MKKNIVFFMLIFSLIFLFTMSIQADIDVNDVNNDSGGNYIYLSTYENPIFSIYYGVETSVTERVSIIRCRLNDILTVINRYNLSEEKIQNSIYIQEENGQFILYFKDIMVITVDGYHAARNISTVEGLAEVWKNNLEEALVSYIRNRYN